MSSSPPPSDRSVTPEEMKAWIREFTDRRDWAKFHHPKDLAVALAIEVGEVLEHFRFRSDAEIAVWLAEPQNRRELGHELADCLWMLLRLSDVTGIDLASALREKLTLADAKYPADRVRGRSDKYTAYAEPPREPEV